MPPAPLVSSVPVPDPEAGMALRACHSAGCCDDVAPASPCICTGSALQDLGQVRAQHGSRAEGPPGRGVAGATGLVGASAPAGSLVTVSVSSFTARYGLLICT